MFDKDSIPFGFLLGLAIPFIGFALLLEIYDQLEAAEIITDIGLSDTFRKRTIALLAVCMNLIPFSIYSKKYYYQTMRGVVFPTVLYVIIWFVYFGSALL